MVEKNKNGYWLLVLAAICLIFSILLGGYLFKKDVLYYKGWVNVEAKPLKSNILVERIEGLNDEEYEPFRLPLHYTFEYQGTTYKGTNTNKHFEDFTQAQRFIDRYNALPSNTPLKCKVYPNNPHVSALFWKGVSTQEWYLWLTLGILILGFCISCRYAYLLLSKSKKGQEFRSHSQLSSGDKWNRISRKKQFSILFLMSITGLSIGLWTGWFNWWVPHEKMVNKKNWRKTSCKVVHATVKKEYHSRAKSSSGYYKYMPKILYSYQANGNTYHSNRYTFDLTSRTGTRDHEAVKEIVSDYKKRGSTYCYVNPKDPREAVLHRKFQSATYHLVWAIATTLAGLFFLVGSLCVLFTKKLKQETESLANE